MTKLFFTSAICIFQWFLCELLFCVWSWLTKFYVFFSRAGKRPYLRRPEFHCLNSDKLVLRCLMNFEKNFEKQFGIQVNENFESIHKLQVVKWNRLTLSSVFRNRSLDDACYRCCLDDACYHRRRGDAKVNVTKKSALFGPLVMQNGFKVWSTNELR